MARATPDILRARARWRDARRPEHVAQPGPGQESVWDYPRPPRIEPVARRVRVEHAGRAIADSLHALRVCETASPPAYYMPPADVERALLVPSATPATVCEWKGRARYWSLRSDDAIVPDIAWSYPDPFEEFAALADFFAFFAGRVDACFVGDARVTPQPGGFYGGWVTPELVGPFKGEPGTDGW